MATTTEISRRLGGDFWRLWWAALISCAGDGIRLGALPVLAATLAHWPWAVAAVSVAGGLPWVIVGPVTGVLTDRWPDRRRILWATDAFAAVVVGLFAVVVASGGATVALLAGLAFVLSSVQTLRDNAAVAFLPQLVPGAALDMANSRVQGAQLFAQELVGPPVGVLLFALPAGLPFFLDAGSFAVAAVLVFGIAVGLTRPAAVAGPVGPPDRTAGLGGVLADMTGGLRWLWRHRLLRALCGLVGLMNLAVMSIFSIAVLYASDVLHVGRTLYAALLAVIAVGAVGGSLLAPVLTTLLGRGTALRLAFGLPPVAFAVAGLTSHALLAALALTAVGAAVGISNVITVSLRQLLVPAGLMGRVTASYRFVAVGMSPLGAALGGGLGQLFGLRAPFLVGAGVLVLAWLVTLRTVSNQDIAAYTARDASTVNG